MQTLRFLVVCGLVLISTGPALGADSGPRVVTAWATGPMEARVAFDRPMDPEVAQQVVGQLVRFGEGEKPGLVGRPGGDRGALHVAAARLVDNGRTLVIVTDPHPRETTYQLTLPILKSPGETQARRQVEVEYNVGGVEVNWVGQGESKPSWSGWWPVVDSEVARALTAGSWEQDQLWPRTLKPGKLTLRTLITLPRGDVPVILDASSPFEATVGVEARKSALLKVGEHQARWKVESTGESIDLSVTIAKDAGPLRLIRLTSDPGGALPRSAFGLPWAPLSITPTPTSAIPPEFLVGGDVVRGEAVFLSEQAKCSTCHQVRGKGGIIGPDLSNLAGRDRTWVYQNIVEPSASIHPDYVTHSVALKDGRIAMGVVRAEGADALKVGDIEGKQTLLPRAEVEEIRPSASSIMPVGLLAAIGEERTRDLLAYLTAPAAR